MANHESPLHKDLENRTTIQFYWDIVSPYSFLAYQRLQHELQSLPVTICHKPILLKHLLSKANNQLPASCFNKGRYIPDDLARWRDFYQLDMKLPFFDVTFPINTQRIMCLALAATHGQLPMDIIGRLFNAYWQQGKRIDKTTELAQVLTPLIASDGDSIQLIQGDHISLQQLEDIWLPTLLQQSEEAVDAGAFGVPTFIVNNDLYFGHDRITLIKHALSHGNEN